MTTITTYETTSGLEYTIIPGGGKNYLADGSPFAWASVRLDIEDGRYELNGYRVEVRYYVKVKSTTVETDPDADVDDIVTETYNYPDFRVTNMTFVRSAPDRNVFIQEDGTEVFPALPGPYAADNPAIGGITDGSEYSYFRVFDQAEVSWLPRCGTINEEYVTEEPVPVDPKDEDPVFPKYPMDALTSYLPDEREAVDLTYTMTTTFDADGWVGDPLLGIPDVPPRIGTETVNITHTCTQDIDGNFGPKLRAALDNCYFSNKYYHVSLYENDDGPIYDDKGNPTGAVKEPEYDGYTLVNSVYDYGIRTVDGPFLRIEDRTPDD